MEAKELYKLLKLVDGVNSSRWSDVCAIVKNFGSVKIVKKEWNDRWKNEHPEYYPLNLSELNTWSTYDGCVDLYFHIQDKLLYCNVVIHEGDNFDGHRKGVRFSAELILPKKFLTEIKDKIQWAFDRYLANEYDKHLLKQRKDFIDNLREEILKSWKQ